MDQSITQAIRLIVQAIFSIFKGLPWFLLAIILLRMTRDVLYQNWKTRLDLSTAQAWAYIAIGIAALSYVGIKI